MQDRDLDLKWSAGGNLSITNLRRRYHGTCHRANTGHSSISTSGIALVVLVVFDVVLVVLMVLVQYHGACHLG